MPGACGIACEVCGFSQACGGGCVSGTDPRARARAQQLRTDYGLTCKVLECAIEKKVDYCLKCGQMPCNIHLEQQEFPYSKWLLDFFKRAKEGKL